MRSDANKVANIVGGRTARACDSCIRKRARWYCAADDAFLCQSCDSAVHSANPLARRHERVRLSTASYKNHADKSRETDSTSVPSWHSRKARTRRGKKSSRSKNPTSEEVVRNPFYLVPEIRSDESTSFDDCDRQQQLYGRVPVLDSLEAVDAGTENNVTPSGEQRSVEFDENEMKGFVGNFCDDLGFLASDMELEAFAADVETLLGKGSGDEPFGIDGLGLMQFSMEVEGSADRSGSGRGRAKDEIEIASGPFESSFDYDKAVAGKRGDDSDEKAVKKMKILLRLDYESIMSAWDRSSPWTSSTRPEVDPNECWPTCTGTCGIEFHEQPLATGLGRRMGQSGDGEREARVSRYREKRRSRLFSKKIRYEVRKLNAEKRPRMKGRFVKRLSSSSSCP